MTTKDIIFDLGGVLISWDPDFVYHHYFVNDLTKMRLFYEETGIRELNKELDAGRSFQEGLSELASKYPHHQEPILLWKTKWLEMIGGPIADSIKILTSLYSQGYQLYALTNWAEETFFTYIHQNPKYSFLNYFKDIVISGVEHVIKPDPKIYKILLERNNLNPKNCIYIDDVPTNLTPAQNLGMGVIEFSSPKLLKTQLESLGISLVRPQ